MGENGGQNAPDKAQVKVRGCPEDNHFIISVPYSALPYIYIKTFPSTKEEPEGGKLVAWNSS